MVVVDDESDRCFLCNGVLINASMEEGKRGLLYRVTELPLQNRWYLACGWGKAGVARLRHAPIPMAKTHLTL